MVPTCSANISCTKVPSCTMWFRQVTKYVTKYITKYDAIPTQPSMTQPIAYLVSKEVIPYQTCDDPCCPRLSIAKIRSVADLITTCHDSINHIHHSNHCSNHNIEPHHSQLISQ
jgi:hypothetical protein